MDVVLVVSVVVAAVLRFWGIGAQSLWYDEWLTADAASGGLRNLGEYVTGSAGIPPTYFGFMWGWARVVGDSDAALRSVSTLAGVAMVPLAYAIAAELFQPLKVARLAAVLLAVNPMLVWYSQEARPYTLMAFLGGLSLWALARAFTRGGRADLVLWVCVATLTVLVHYYAVFLIAVEALALLVVRRPQVPQLIAAVRQRPRAWLRALAPAWVPALAIAPFAAKQVASSGQHQWIADHDLGVRLRGIGTGLLVGPSQPTGRIWMGVGAVVLLAVVLLVVRGNLIERVVSGALAVLVVGPVGLGLVAKVVGLDAVLERYFIFLVVPLVMVVAIGLGASRVPTWAGAAAVAVAVASSLVVVVTVARDADLQRSDWEAIADAHDAVPAAEADRVLVVNVQGYLGQPMQRYLDDASVLGEDERIMVERIDVVVAEDSTRPCNGLIGRSCNFFFLGGMPPAVQPGYEPVDPAEMEALAELAELDEEEQEALAEVAGDDPEPEEDEEDEDLEPADVPEWVERIELEQFSVDRYELDEPQLMTREDLVAPRWDGKWKALVLVSESGS